MASNLFSIRYVVHESDLPAFTPPPYAERGWDAALPPLPTCNPSFSFASGRHQAGITGWC